MKIGDKLYCKKRFMSDESGYKYIFDVGVYYKVYRIYDTLNLVGIKIDNDFVTFKMHIVKNNKSGRYVWDYFVTDVKELRRKKLEIIGGLKI